SFTDPAPTPISTLSLHDALPILHALVRPVPDVHVGLRLRVGAALPLDLLALLLHAGEHARAVPAPLQAAQLAQHHPLREARVRADRKSTRLNSSHVKISYAVFCL